MEGTLGPIDVLMNLVITKEVDPWNVDIVDLTKKYLRKIKEAKRIDMRVSGKTILVATILIRMQSETMLEKKKKEKKEEFDEEYTEVPPVLPPLRRESREITLPSLLEALLETLEDYERKKSKRSKRQKKLKKEIKQIIKVDVHRKNLEKYVKKLYTLIKDSMDEGGILPFEDLIFDDTTLERARTFLYLLFLQQQGKIKLIQDKFFEPLYIKLTGE
ncbi:MAG: segregation/condensation protein A [Euryarchaeota archaeon]|nr:segregation/condensation protein A [Euryarchaeota archaeon]